MKHSSFRLTRATKLAALVIALSITAVPESSKAILGLFEKDSGKPATTEAYEGQNTKADGILNEARSLEANNQFSKAHDVYKSIVKTYPRSTAAGEAQFKVAELLQAEGKEKKAFEAYQKFLTEYKSNTRFSEAVQRQYSIADTLMKNGSKGFMGGLGASIQPSKLIEMFEQVSGNAPRTEIAARSRLAVGSIYSEQGDLTKAISTFEGVVTDYPGTQFAKDAQYQSFRLRGREADKSFSQVDLRQQREAGEDFITQFGSDPRATDIKASLGKLEDKELEKSFDVGRFYERQGNLHAAVIYYREVVAHPGAKSYNDAKKRLEQIVQRDPTLAAVAAGQRKPMTETGGGLPIPPKPGNSAQFMGPPPPTMENSKPRMRTSTDEVLPIPSDDPTAAN